jgi:hypothetical protein
MLTEHWNGKTWSLVRTPMVTSNDSFLTTVVARASNDVWAGGGYNNGTTGSSLGFTIHWDGKKWSVVKLDPLKSPYYPVEGLTAVPGGGALFALGSYDDNKRKRYSEFAEQLGKSSWSQLNPLGPNDYYYFGDTTFITGAAATSNFGVYGVGYYTRGGLVSTFAMVWDGSRWAVTLTPNVAGYDSFLNAASAIPGTKNVWAAGGFSLGSTAGPLIEHGECM